LEKFSLSNEDEKLYKNNIISCVNSVTNTTSMFYNHYKNMQLIEEYGKKYDVVLYLRADMLPSASLELPLQIEKNTIYIPSSYDYNGINDQMAFGDFESMKKYTSLYAHLNTYIKNKEVGFHPETILQYHLKKIGVNISRFEFPYDLNEKRKV
jgi:hypothetical protein